LTTYNNDLSTIAIPVKGTSATISTIAIPVKGTSAAIDTIGIPVKRPDAQLNYINFDVEQYPGTTIRNSMPVIKLDNYSPSNIVAPDMGTAGIGDIQKTEVSSPKLGSGEYSGAVSSVDSGVVLNTVDYTGSSESSETGIYTVDVGIPDAIVGTPDGPIETYLGDNQIYLQHYNTNIINTVPYTPYVGNTIIYGTTADTVRETTSRIWFTPEERYMLRVAYYNTVSHSYTEEKAMVFVITEYADPGPQKIHLRFPWDGVITNIHSTCAVLGTDVDDVLNIECCHKEDYISPEPIWTPILGTNIEIGRSIKVVEGDTNIPVLKDDMFRLHFYVASHDIRYITVQLVVKVNI
jgi:hypothetical protein